MNFEYNDGGREKAGYKGSAGDCVTRAIAIASGRPYQEIYKALAEGTGTQRASSRTSKRAKSARNGISIRRKWFKDYMKGLGFVWTPTMQIGSGCKVHLVDGELPDGRLVVSVSKHYTAVIDGVIHDTHNPQRSTLVCENYIQRIAHRCVYGYWKLNTAWPHTGGGYSGQI